MSTVQSMVDSSMRTGASGSTLASTSSSSFTKKVDPSPGVDSTATDPPIISASSLQINRPRPVPPNSRVVDESTCENSWNSFRCPSSSMPMPVSCTANVHMRWRARFASARGSASSYDTLSFTNPFDVNLSAFDTRLCNTCRNRVGSPSTRTGRLGGHSSTSSTPIFIAFGALVCSVNSHDSRTENGIVSNEMLPDSIFVTSITSFTMDSSRLDARVMPLT
mmetsp:Transcript_10650/g.33738  ORF Transcript_10650/g.33738 Transcript_10650/m.33738 type:complete len:221 (-) Transcript_10650:1003-1665(-)